jgi:hypothetical protein
MDIFSQLRRGNLISGGYQGEDCAVEKSTMPGQFRPQTITELIDAQIGFHEAKIADLKAAKEAISPEVEKALNALAKIS